MDRSLDESIEARQQNSRPSKDRRPPRDGVRKVIQTSVESDRQQSNLISRFFLLIPQLYNTSSSQCDFDLEAQRISRCRRRRFINPF
jgi:hypothetical protein